MRHPTALLTYHCKHCGAIVALIAPGAIKYDTRLTCPQCATVLKILKPVDTERIAAYTTSAPA